MGRLGVLGGSFNPVHLAHLHVARLAREAGGLDEVLFVPAARPPHKAAAALAPAPHRLAMLQLALEGESEFALCDIELHRDGPRYTVETLDTLARSYPGRRLTFIMGLDSLADLPGWRDPERILESHAVIAVDRPGLDPKAVDPGLAGRVRIVTGNPLAISSTRVRERVAAGRSIRELVPHGVDTYIAEHGLYRDPDS
jgi:nicotinate-nucleotide adenylyltransferase